MMRAKCWTLLLVIVTLLVGCFAAPYSQRYQPEDAAEQQAFARAHRDIFPDDVRQDIGKYRSDLLLWTGIIKRAEFSEATGVLRVLVEHHYWDWIEDHGHQKAVAFLSPRGEGLFECQLSIPRTELRKRVARVEDMAIVYGAPVRISDDGVVAMSCPVLRTLKKEFYSTEIWEYGRNFSNPRAVAKP
jgi:hypothetical protein